MPSYGFSDHRFVVSFSGGIGSFVAAAKTIEKYGKDRVDLVFCDTLIEDPDLYRFLDDAERVLGVRITRLKDGRTPWQVFEDLKFIGNSRFAPCSKTLKSDVFEKHLLESGKYKLLPYPNATIVLGIDWLEEHRFTRAKANWAPWPVIAPLCEPPLLKKSQVLDYFSTFNIATPALYALGFDHNNCGGFCVRAGQAHFARLLQTKREYYLWNEEQEAAVMQRVPSTKPFLRTQSGDDVRYLTLKQFREHLEKLGDYDVNDFGGCGCFVNDGRENRPRLGQNGTPIAQLLDEDLNEKELQVLNFLRSRNMARIREIATVFDQPKLKAEDWVRASLRRLVRARLVSKVGKGLYEVASTTT